MAKWSHAWVLANRELATQVTASTASPAANQRSNRFSNAHFVASSTARKTKMLRKAVEAAHRMPPLRGPRAPKILGGPWWDV